MINSSPILKSSNNIVKINTRQENSYRQAKNQYSRILTSIETNTAKASRKKLPHSSDILSLSTFSLISKFGIIGNLIRRFANKSLDVAGVIRNFFPGKNSKIGSVTKNDKSTVKPRVVNNRLKLGGIRALGVTNALFAGLDFATGLQKGETVGKAASGAAGSLAGSLLGGVIGQALIPVPGLGFIVGSTVGGLLGGFTGDRVYEGVSEVKRKQEEKLKEKPQDKSIVETSSLNTSIQLLNSIIKKFEIPVNKFQSFVKDIIDGKIIFGGGRREVTSTAQTQQNPPGEDMGPLEEMEATGGSLPSKAPTTGLYEEQRPTHIHQGIDKAMPDGTPISVIQPGVVESAGFEEGGYGNVIRINHPGGIQTLYSHLSAIRVRKGQEVTPGTVIGNVGSTGRSTGPHLHFEVRVNGKNTNPEPYMDKVFRFGGDVKVKPKPITTPDLDLRSGDTSQQPSSIIPQVPIESILTATLIGTPETLMASKPDLNYNFPYNEENNETFIFLEQPEIAYLLGGGNQTPLPSSPQTNNPSMSFSTDLFTEQKAEEIALNRLLMASLS